MRWQHERPAITKPSIRIVLRAGISMPASSTLTAKSHSLVVRSVDVYKQAGRWFKSILLHEPQKIKVMTKTKKPINKRMLFILRCPLKKGGNPGRKIVTVVEELPNEIYRAVSGAVRILAPKHLFEELP